MVAPQDDLALRHAVLSAKAQDVGVEIRGQHARIAAVLVDLVGCGLDEHRGTIALGADESCAQHIFVGTAAGIDPCGYAPLLAIEDGHQWMHS